MLIHDFVFKKEPLPAQSLLLPESAQLSRINAEELQQRLCGGMAMPASAAAVAVELAVISAGCW
jgi:hypothetical protein